MTATLVEHAQFLDDSGAPISGGLQYFGTNGSDPVATSGVTTIFSDRDLTTSISNPQTLGTDGRTLNKVWVSGKYSTQVNSVVGIVETQEFQDLDAGTASSANSSLFITSIVGADTITGSSDQSLSSYTANQQFVFETASANTGAVTLNVDSVGAKAIVKNNDQAIVAGELAANQVVIVAYNETNDNFEWVNQNNKVVQFSEGTSVVAAATTDIWATDGNTIHITGTTAITSFGTAPNVGARRTVIFDDVVTLTDSTNLALPGGVDFTTAAGDILEVYADTVSQFDVTIYPKSGQSVNPRFLQRVSVTDSAFATGTTTIPRDDTIPQNTEGTEFITLAITPESASSTLEITATLFVGCSVVTAVAAALFVDTTADALAAVNFRNSANDRSVVIVLKQLLSSASTSARTYKIRMGPTAAATITFNGESGARLYGGVAASSIVITEYE